MHKIVMEITWLIMEKSWNCVFEFLWEPCYRELMCQFNNLCILGNFAFFLVDLQILFKINFS